MEVAVLRVASLGAWLRVRAGRGIPSSCTITGYNIGGPGAAMRHSVVAQETIERKILLIRGQKALLDRDLAALYDVQTRDLNKAVRRNLNRFPEDFMLQISPEEFRNLMFQFGTSRWGGTRKRPYAFTEQGVAMLSSVLHSERAVQVNIAIMRTFVNVRRMLSTHKVLAEKLVAMEQSLEKHDEHIRTLFSAIRQLMEPPQKPKRQIGFQVKEAAARYHTKRKR